MEVRYFEIEFSDNHDENTWEYICIKGTHQPTIEEAQNFCSKDSEMYKMPVTGVFPIDETTARGSYDFDNELAWPIFQ